jgi:hypothetical protein
MNILTPDDLNQIRTLLTDNNVVLRSEIRDGNAVLRSEIRDNNAVLRSEIRDNNIVLRAGILADVGEMLEQNVLPRFDEINARFDHLEGRVGTVEATMVTKDYLDDKIGKLRGEFVTGGRSPNQQFGHSF